MSGNPIRVLLVDDDEVDRMAVRRAFAELKIANPITVSDDGLHALDILRGNDPIKLERPYVIILDLNMPRMNGIEFLHELRADPGLKDAVVFVLTTSNDDEDKVAAYRHNIAGYILKSDVANGFMQAVSMLDHYWRVVELVEE